MNNYHCLTMADRWIGSVLQILFLIHGTVGLREIGCYDGDLGYTYMNGTITNLASDEPGHYYQGTYDVKDCQRACRGKPFYGIVYKYDKSDAVDGSRDVAQLICTCGDGEPRSELRDDCPQMRGTSEWRVSCEEDMPLRTRVFVSQYEGNCFQGGGLADYTNVLYKKLKQVRKTSWRSSEMKYTECYTSCSHLQAAYIALSYTRVKNKRGIYLHCTCGNSTINTSKSINCPEYTYWVDKKNEITWKWSVFRHKDPPRTVVYTVGESHPDQNDQQSGHIEVDAPWTTRVTEGMDITTDTAPESTAKTPTPTTAETTAGVAIDRGTHTAALSTVEATAETAWPDMTSPPELNMSPLANEHQAGIAVGCFALVCLGLGAFVYADKRLSKTKKESHQSDQVYCNVVGGVSGVHQRAPSTSEQDDEPEYATTDDFIPSLPRKPQAPGAGNSEVRPRVPDKRGMGEKCTSKNDVTIMDNDVYATTDDVNQCQSGQAKRPGSLSEVPDTRKDNASHDNGVTIMGNDVYTTTDDVTTQQPRQSHCEDSMYAVPGKRRMADNAIHHNDVTVGNEPGNNKRTSVGDDISTEDNVVYAQYKDW